MGEPDPELTIVEHLHNSELTLHRSDCIVLRRVTITHPVTTYWLDQIDHVCGTCKPEH